VIGGPLPIKFYALWAILSHMNTPPVNKQRAEALRQILASQRDQHARQRELVRASLAWCPGKTRPAQSR
jgi:hypothetical protein